MGQLNSVLSTINGTLGTIAAIDSTVNALTGGDTRSQRKALQAEQNLALNQLKQQQQLEEKQAAAEAERNRTQITLNAQQEEERRRKALKRAVAKQNASRGAAGISSTGSNEAVLLGLYNDTNADAVNASALDQLRYNTIDSGLYDLTQQNVLERTQLAEKQRLERAVSGY